MPRTSRACAVIAALLGATLAAAEVPSIAWTSGWKAAERRARAEHKPMLVDFWAEWCEWCHELDRTTYRDPAVLDLAKAFVPVKVNAEGSLGEVELAAQHEVSTLPTIAFLSPGGRVFLRRTAFEGPEAFAATLEEARRVGAEAIAFETALERNGKDAAALAGLGALLASQDLMKDARELLGRARRLDQARPVAERKRTRRLLAEAEQARGRRSESLSILAEALALQPPDAAEDAEAARLRAALVAR
jgi:thioredoxin-like negative regulator of GroEL